MTLLHQAAQKAVEALNHIVRRLQMDIDDGGRPDQWSMEDLVRKAQPAIDAVQSALQQPEQATEPAWGITPATLNRHVSPGITLGHELNRLRQYDAAALQHQEVPREPVADARILHLWDTHVGEPTEHAPLTGKDKLAFARAVLYAAASPSTTRQQEVGGGAAFCPCSFCDSADACRERGCADAAYGREVAGRRAAAGGHTGDTERVRCVSCEWRGLVTDCAGFEQCDCPMCLAPVTDCPEAAPSTPENAGGGPHG